mgnify:FL=1
MRLEQLESEIEQEPRISPNLKKQSRRKLKRGLRLLRQRHSKKNVSLPKRTNGRAKFIF